MDGRCRPFCSEFASRSFSAERTAAAGRPGVTSSESAEIKRLKAENRRLREDNEILKAATVFFAGELDPRNR